MKFFSDENLPPILIELLKRISNSQTKSISSKKEFGLSDQQIAQRSINDKSIVVTFDKDFLAIDDPKFKLIYLIFPKTDPKDVVPYLEAAIKIIPSAEKKKKGYIVYVSKHSISVVPYTKSPSKK